MITFSELSLILPFDAEEQSFCKGVPCCQGMKYREDLTFDRFTALRFMATGTPPAAWRIRFFLMNQYS
jgi:hypothetical protein